MKPLRIFVLSVMLILTVSALGQDTKTVAVSTAPQAQGSQAAQESLSGCAENQTRSIALSLPSFWMSSAHSRPSRSGTCFHLRSTGIFEKCQNTPRYGGEPVIRCA